MWVHDEGGLGRGGGDAGGRGQIHAAVAAARGLLGRVRTRHLFPELLQFCWNHA